MSCLSSFFCCFPSQSKNGNSVPPHHASRPAASGGRLDSLTGYGNNNHIYGIDGAQESTSSLPRYTARPISVYEKTIVFGRGTNPQDTNNEVRDTRDEKRQQQFIDNINNHNNNNDNRIDQDGSPNQQTSGGSSEDQSSDASSTFSIPSSYGNTSTATRTPPPPPYSPNTSRAPSQRARSMSLTRAGDDAAARDTPELQQPQPVLRRGRGQHRDDQWFSWNVEAGRRSRESGRSTPPLPPSYSRK